MSGQYVIDVHRRDWGVCLDSSAPAQAHHGRRSIESATRLRLLSAQARGEPAGIYDVDCAASRKARQCRTCSSGLLDSDEIWLLTG